MLSGLKFASAPDAAKLLHFMALCYAAENLTDGYITESAARKLTKARGRDFERAIEHLSTTQPGCTNPSWELQAGDQAQPNGDRAQPNRVWFLHHYDDPLYDNPMKAGLDKRREQKSRAGVEGGKKSAEARAKKYGTARPLNSAREADPEAGTRTPTEAGASSGASAVQPSKPPSTHEADSKLARAGAHAQPLPSPPSPSLPLPSTHASTDNALQGTNGASLDALLKQHDPDDDLGLQLAVRMTQLLGRDLAPMEVSMCSIFVDDFAYLSVDDMVERARSHVAHCKAAKLPLPQKMHGFRETLRLQNDHVADGGAAKAWRPPPLTIPVLHEEASR